MDREELIEYQWPYLLRFVTERDQFEASAYRMGAISRSDSGLTASDLLRVAMVYGFCGRSLRQTAAWAEATGLARISAVALRKRLRAAAEWLGHLVGSKLLERSRLCPPKAAPWKIRIVDATTISCPGSRGIDWRLHTLLDLERLVIEQIELTDRRSGESLTRFRFGAGELVVADRGYAHRNGLAFVHSTGADYLIRLNWSNVPLQTRSGAVFDLLAALRSLPEAEPGDFALTVPLSGGSVLPARLLAVRKSEAAAAVSRQRVLRERAKRGTIDPRTLETAGYVFVLTSLGAAHLTAAEGLELYRFRWQIELVFKRLKTLLAVDELPAKDPPLVRTILYTKLLGALLVEDFAERFLAFSPWGYPLAAAQGLALANSPDHG